MPTSGHFPLFPDSVPASAERPSFTYRRVPGWFAVHGAPPSSLTLPVVFTLNEGAISVCRGEPPDPRALPPSLLITPVYSFQPGGRPAVPTGRIFIRFAEQIRADARRDALAQAGYRIVDLPSYAPQAAWVEPAEGGVAASLAGLARLQALTEIVNVEPEMLTQRVLR